MCSFVPGMIRLRRWTGFGVLDGLRRGRVNAGLLLGLVVSLSRLFSLGA
jgi:hypothetical protein